MLRTSNQTTIACFGRKQKHFPSLVWTWQAKSDNDNNNNMNLKFTDFYFVREMCSLSLCHIVGY